MKGHGFNSHNVQEILVFLGGFKAIAELERYALTFCFRCLF